MKPKSQIGLALLIIYLVWGSTYLAIRYAIATIPPFLMAGSRFICAGLLLYLFLRFRGSPRPTRTHWISAFFVGTFLLLGGNGLVGWAEQTVESGLAALLVSVAPLWMVFFEWIGPRKKKVSPVVFGGLMLGFFGVALLIGPRIYHEGMKHNAGLIALVLAPMLWGIGSVQSKQVSFPSSVFMVTAIEMLAGGMILFAVGLLLGETQSFSWALISTTSWMAFIYLVLIGALVGFTTYIWLIMNAPLALAGTYAYVNPVVAVLLGWGLAGERLTLRSVVAGGVILLAVGLITCGEFQKKSEAT